jgi:hypothetical protein
MKLKNKKNKNHKCKYGLYKYIPRKRHKLNYKNTIRYEKCIICGLKKVDVKYVINNLKPFKNET